MSDIYMTPLKTENRREMYFDAHEQSYSMREAKLVSIGKVEPWGQAILAGICLLVIFVIAAVV